MTVIESTVLIQRPPEEVFDYLSDPRNELEWNPKVRVMEKLTDGPVGVGTKFRAKWTKSTRFTSRFDATPHGFLRLLFPVFVRLIRREEAANMELIKRAVETR